MGDTESLDCCREYHHYHEERKKSYWWNLKYYYYFFLVPNFFLRVKLMRRLKLINERGWGGMIATMPYWGDTPGRKRVCRTNLPPRLVSRVSDHASAAGHSSEPSSPLQELPCPSR